MSAEVAMKAIKTLAEVAMNTEDTDVLHRHLQLIINVVENYIAGKKDSDDGSGRQA